MDTRTKTVEQTNQTSSMAVVLWGAAILIGYLLGVWVAKGW